jgi:hypothetical protein
MVVAGGGVLYRAGQVWAVKCIIIIIIIIIKVQVRG